MATRCYKKNDIMSQVPSMPKGTKLCRCCGKPVYNPDAYPIHTRCIPKHWGKHAHGINCSRCKEFGKLADKGRSGRRDTGR